MALALGEAMRQWFRGELEAHYEGVPSTHPSPAKDMRGQPHQIRIYRAHVRKLELIDAPSEPRPHTSSLGSGATTPTSTHVLFQARVEHARLEHQNPRGICLEGPIF